MSMHRITAIVPVECVDPLEESLRLCGVPGVTVEHVQGYGEHPNFFRRDLMHENARLVLYVEHHEVDGVVDAIVKTIGVSSSEAGILAVESIDRLIRLSDGSEITSSSSTRSEPR